MNHWETSFLFFAFLSFILFLLFFLKKKGDKIANKILGAYLLLFALNIIYNVLFWSKQLFTADFFHLIGILPIIWATYPPLMYLYIKRFTDNNKLGFRDIIHVVPPLTMIALYSRFFILNADSKRDVLLNGGYQDYVYFLEYINWIAALIMILYIVAIHNSLKNITKLSANKMKWIRWVAGAFYCYVVAMVSYFLLSHFQVISTEHDYYIMYTIIFFIGLVTYFGFMQPEVFNGLPMEQVLPFKKYQKTGLSEHLSLELKGKLINLMDTERPYLNSNLRLNDLAEQLNVSKHHMSQIINEHFNTTFFIFINSYRIKEAKHLLENDNALTVSDVIYSCGFNNRVSFYKAFKMHTGVTPTQFKLNPTSETFSI